MLKTILVPLDGSSAAEIVFPFVEEIAARLGSKIILVTAAEPKPTDLYRLYDSYLEQVKEQIQTQLKDYGVDKVTELYSKVLPGSPADEILQYAEQADVDLIVMASHGSSRHGPWLLGNIAAKVLRVSRKPVLLIRAPAGNIALQEKRIIKRILVPLDGSVTGEAAISFAETLGQALGAELVLYRVLEPLTMWAGYVGADGYIPQGFFEDRKASAIAYLEGVRERLRERGLITAIEVEAGPPADLIIDYSKSKAIDIIAMSTHGRSGIGRWVFGSVTDKILHSGDAAVLVVRAV